MADPTPTPDPTSDPATPPADPTPTDPPKPETGDDDKGKGGKDALLADLAKERDRRQELEQRFADAETQRREQMDAFAKALGLKPDDTPADPAKLAEQISAEQAKATAAEARAVEAERRLAVFQAAPALEGNALALLDSASFLTSINEIDPTDAEKLGAAITAAIEKNPLFKANPAVPTPPFPGGPRPSAPTRAGSLEEAIAARFSSNTR